jgi:phytol kinase
VTLAFVAAFFATLCVAVELLARRVRLPAEVTRKLAHMSSAVFAACLPLVLSFHEIAALGLAFTAAMAVSRETQIFTAIHGVARTTYGEVFFPLGIAVLAVVCPDKRGFAFGLLVLGLGDGLAALVGGKLGRRVVPLVRTSKTLWGSGTFLFACFVLAAVLLASAGIAIPAALVAAAAIAIALTPVELVLTYGLDNIALPPLAGLLLIGL